MLRRFECSDCHHQFDADDEKWVSCPSCHSDNVDYYRFHVPYKVYYICCAAIVVVGAAIWFCTLESRSVPVQPDVTTKDSVYAESTRKADSTYINEGNSIDPSLAIVENEYDKETETYTFKVAVSYPPKQPWKIVIKKRGNDDIVAESNDGIFKNIPYSDDDGSYIIRLTSRKSNDSLLCEERLFPVFPRLNRVKVRWTEADVEMALKNNAPLVDTPFVANPHKVEVTNKPQGDSSPTQSLRDVQQLLKASNLNVIKVDKVEHNDLNQITKVLLRIDYPEDWIANEDY